MMHKPSCLKNDLCFSQHLKAEILGNCRYEYLGKKFEICLHFCSPSLEEVPQPAVYNHSHHRNQFSAQALGLLVFHTQSQSQ